jgi:hypothetical protein
VQRRRVRPWLDEEWAPRLLVSTAFVALLIPAIGLVLDLNIGESWGAGLVIWVVVAAVFAYYSRIRDDLFMLTSAGGAVMTVLTVAIGRVILQELKLETFGGLLMAMILIGEVTLGVAWLRRMTGRASTPGPNVPAAPTAPLASEGEVRE